MLGITIVITAYYLKPFMKKRLREKAKNRTSKPHLNAVRGGRKCTISEEDLLVGDVVEIKEEMVMSVDGVLIEGSV
jgi:magnesium-transporting ATPase (P-type)